MLSEKSIMKKKDNKNSKNAVVTKHHDLITANFRLGVNENRLVSTLISRIHPDDKEFKRYYFNISDLYKLLKLNKEKLFVRRRRFKKILNNLQRNLIEVFFWKDGRSLFATPAWIAEPIFDFEKDEISIIISETLKPYLLKLKGKGRFASWRLCEVLNFRCDYSSRFLEFCRDFEPRPDFHDLVVNNRYVKREYYDLDDLRKLLGLSTDQYPRPYDFKNRVLAPAHREVIKHTSSYFEFKLIKKGRKVGGVELLIYGGAIAPEKIKLDDAQKSQVSLAQRLGCSLTFATTFVIEHSHKPDDLWRAVIAVEEYAEWLSGKGEKLKFAASALKKSFFEGWHSKRWNDRQERELKQLKAEDRERERKDLQKALKQLERRQKKTDQNFEKQFEEEQTRQNQKYARQVAEWSLEYEKLEESKKETFIIEKLPDDLMTSLSGDQIKKVKGFAKKFTKNSSHSFTTIYDAAFSFLLECFISKG